MGCKSTFQNDNRVFIYDQYNLHIFPQDVEAQRRIDCKATVPSGWAEIDYLAALESRLPPFLDSVMQKGDVRLAIYNAGSGAMQKGTGEGVAGHQARGDFNIGFAIAE